MFRSATSVLLRGKAAWTSSMVLCAGLCSLASAQGSSSPPAGNSWSSIAALPQMVGQWTPDEKSIAAGIGVTVNMEFPPFKPKYLAQARTRVRNITLGKQDFLTGGCRPRGMPRLMMDALDSIILYSPGVVSILTAGDLRMVHVDGSPHPPGLTDPDALEMPSPNGHQIGHWEGDNLVVDTIGVDPEAEIFYGVAQGGPIHIIERYRLVDPDTLQMHMTIDDPLMLEKPWEVNRSWVRVRNMNYVARFCDPDLSHEKVDANGNVSLDLTPPSQRRRKR
jgi:hypothetical protein